MNSLDLVIEHATTSRGCFCSAFADCSCANHWYAGNVHSCAGYVFFQFNVATFVI